MTDSLKPHTRQTGSEWADTYRIVPAGTSPEPGKWRTDRVPYLKEIVDVATDHKTQRVVVMSASQIGKSEMLLNVLGFFIHQEPAPILMLQPTVEAAQDFSKERIDPMIQATDVLRGAVSGEDRGDRVKTSRKSSDTILKKNFKGGYIALVGSNATTGLASRPIRVVLMDEVDRYGETKEGDPIKLAEQRTRNFFNRKIVKVSTPTFFNTKIHHEYEASDKREFFITCPHCGEEVLLDWKMVEWKLDKNKRLIEDSIKILCPKCKELLRDGSRINPSLLITGKWKPTANSDIAGFHLSALYSPWTPLIDLVREYLRAIGTSDRKGLQEFVNLQLGLPYDPFENEQQSWQKLLARCENYPEGKIPDDVLILTAGVDVQRNRLECSLYGWGLNHESWLIDHRQIMGDPKTDEPWKALDEYLLHTRFITKSGKRRIIGAVFVDSGDGYTTSNVYHYTKRRERFRFASIKGRGGFTVPYVDRAKRVGDCKALLYELGVDAGKSIVTGALAVQIPGPNYVHFPKGVTGVDEEFFKQLTAEVYQAETTASGDKKYSWVKIRDRNEALDCAVYARAALEALNINFEALKRKVG